MNPARTPEQRIAAALVLMEHDPEGEAKVRVASSLSADNNLRQALEEVCEGTLTEETLRRQR